MSEIITRRDESGLPYAEKADGSRVYLRDTTEEEETRYAEELLRRFGKKEEAA